MITLVLCRSCFLKYNHILPVDIKVVWKACSDCESPDDMIDMIE